MADMEKETENTMVFDMGALRINRPEKRGLSRYYSGKSRSFADMNEVHCLEDLKKQQRPNVKKRKKYSDRQGIQVPPEPCRSRTTCDQYALPIIGV